MPTYSVYLLAGDWFKPEEEGEPPEEKKAREERKKERLRQEAEKPRPKVSYKENFSEANEDPAELFQAQKNYLRDLEREEAKTSFEVAALEIEDGKYVLPGGEVTLETGEEQYLIPALREKAKQQGWVLPEDGTLTKYVHNFDKRIIYLMSNVFPTASNLRDPIGIPVRVPLADITNSYEEDPIVKSYLTTLSSKMSKAPKYGKGEVSTRTLKDIRRAIALKQAKQPGDPSLVGTKGEHTLDPLQYLAKKETAAYKKRKAQRNEALDIIQCLDHILSEATKPTGGLRSKSSDGAILKAFDDYLGENPSEKTRYEAMSPEKKTDYFNTFSYTFKKKDWEAYLDEPGVRADFERKSKEAQKNELNKFMKEWQAPKTSDQKTIRQEKQKFIPKQKPKTYGKIKGSKFDKSSKKAGAQKDYTAEEIKALLDQAKHKFTDPDELIQKPIIYPKTSSSEQIRGFSKRVSSSDSDQGQSPSVSKSRSSQSKIEVEDRKLPDISSLTDEEVYQFYRLINNPEFKISYPKSWKDALVSKKKEIDQDIVSKRSFFTKKRPKVS